MTPDEINIAIAEHCGWMQIYADPKRRWANPARNASGLIPNYHGDLNAMHEAEKRLCPDQHKAYLDLVFENTDFAGSREWRRAHATAAQRAEAFLRTVGKWKEGA